VFAAPFPGSTHPEPVAAVSLVLGVFLGSALWWLGLSGVVSMLRSRFDSRGLRWVNIGSGVVVVAFAVVALVGVGR
jgi:arginine exporter protein ArgO